MRGAGKASALNGRRFCAVYALPPGPLVTSRVLMTLVCVCLVGVPATGAAQTRFDGIEQSGVAGVPGLHVITVRDTVLKTCYLVFVSEPGETSTRRTTGPADVEQARGARDGRLAELLRGYEQDRSAIPGTIIPNPLKYDWLADAAQLEFALYVLQQQFVRLEQQLARLADASRMAMTTTQVPCGPSDGRASP